MDRSPTDASTEVAAELAAGETHSGALTETSGEAALSPIFRNALESLREELNHKARLRLEQGVKLETQELQRHLRDRVGPIIDAVHACLPERSRVATSELFDVSLELFSAGQLGPTSKSLNMERLWRSVLPKLSMLIARDPRRIVGSLCNGILYAEHHSSGIAGRWLDKIEAVGNQADSSQQFLTLGKFAAWTAGMAHCRPAALGLADTLPWSIVGALLDLPLGFTAASVSRFLQRAASNPWEDGRQASKDLSDKIEFVKRCGAFRGFGGAILAPPQVALRDGRFLLTDQQSVWQLIADHFGSIQQRIELPIPQLSDAPSKSRLHFTQPRVDDRGTIHWGQQQLSVPLLTQPTSYACDGETLAVTIATSFHVFLFARRCA